MPTTTVDSSQWDMMSGSVTVLSIDGKAIGNTTLYTVPTGYKLMVSRVMITPTTVSGFTVPAIVSVGKTGASYVDVAVGATLTSLSATGLVTNLLPIAAASVLSAGEALVMRVSTGATATTYTLSATVIGTLMPA